MLKDDAVYVGHMLDMARQARELVASRTRADCDADRLPAREDQRFAP
jgi:hypothetical protein